MSQADNLIPDFEEAEFDDREEKEKPKPRKPMKIEKEPESDWRIQWNRKIGEDLLNIRGRTFAEFKEVAKDCMDNLEFFAALTAMFDFRPETKESELPLAPATPKAVPTPQTEQTQGVEIGPIVVEKVEEVSGMSKEKIDPKTGRVKPSRPYTRHVVTFRSGVKATTFDTMYAEIATKLLGALCYARIQQTQYGNDLVSIRPAA